MLKRWKRKTTVSKVSGKWVPIRRGGVCKWTTSVRDCFIACLKAKSKHCEHLLWCVSLCYVTVMTFKAHTTAVINKLTYVSFHRVGWKQPSTAVRRGGQFCCSFVANLLKYLCAKTYENFLRFDKVIEKIIRVQFSASPSRMIVRTDGRNFYTPPVFSNPGVVNKLWQYVKPFS